VTTTIQSFARKYIKPFIGQVSDLMNDDENLGKRLLFFVLRLFIIFVAMGFVVVIAKIIDRFIGGDIVKEEEIVIVHEYDTQEEADKARAAAARSKRSKKERKED